MELKSGMENDEGESGGVLIVPLWNWNFQYPWQVGADPSSNCTFMELKSENIIIHKTINGSSNCTFMELKLYWDNKGWRTPKVLIVPLWNWNMFCKFSRKNKSTVLIVPLWNWNIVEIILSTVSSSSNCTFMELKSLYRFQGQYLLLVDYQCYTL